MLLTEYEWSPKCLALDTISWPQPERINTSISTFVRLLNRTCTSSARIRRLCTCVWMLLRARAFPSVTKLLEGTSSALIGGQSVDDAFWGTALDGEWLVGFAGWRFVCRFPGLRVAMQRSFLWVWRSCWSDSERGFFDEVQRRLLWKSWWVLSELLVVWRACKRRLLDDEKVRTKLKARAKVTAKARQKATQSCLSLGYKRVHPTCPSECVSQSDIVLGGTYAPFSGSCMSLA